VPGDPRNYSHLHFFACGHHSSSVIYSACWYDAHLVLMDRRHTPPFTQYYSVLPGDKEERNLLQNTSIITKHAPDRPMGTATNAAS